VNKSLIHKGHRKNISDVLLGGDVHRFTENNSRFILVWDCPDC
jgi:hypothetical protein